MVLAMDKRQQVTDVDPNVSRFVRNAFGLSQVGKPLREGARCAICGDAIEAGQNAQPFKPGENFNDLPSIAAANTRNPYSPSYACGDCAALMAKPVMERLGYAVITRDGAWPLSRDAHRAALLTDPPEPPFVAQIKTTQLQHLAWRATLTLSRDYIRVCLGGRMIDVNRTLVGQALTKIRDELNGRHPFQRLDRALADPAHGRIRGDVSAEHRRWFSQLGNGELWALAVLAKRNPPVPEWGPQIAPKQ